MGENIPPEEPPIVYGDDCLCCFDAGETPKFIEVTFSDVDLCPARTWPNGENVNKTFLLTQLPGNPCVWQYFPNGNWQILLQGNLFGCTRSRLRAHTTVGGVADYFDSEAVLGVCLADYVNDIELEDCDGGHKGHNGTGTVYWPT